MVLGVRVLLGRLNSVWRSMKADLLFSVRREPIAKRIVLDVPYDMFSKGFTVEEAAEKPDPVWSREVAKVFDDLNAKSVLRQLFIYERLFGWSALALTYVDFGGDPSQPLNGAKEIRELVPYSSLNCTVLASDEDNDESSSRFGLPVLYAFRRSASSLSLIHISEPTRRTPISYAVFC